MPHSGKSSQPHLPVTAQLAPIQPALAAVCGRVAEALEVGVCVVIASRSVSTRHRVHATDQVAAWLDDRQYVLGQGPIVDVLTTRAPILIPDTDEPQVSIRWSAFAQEIAGRPVRAVFVFPLLVGDAMLGTAQLHRAQPRRLTPVQVAALPGFIAELVTAVLDDHTGTQPDASGDDESDHIAMAVGMVAVQLGTSLPNALAQLRGTAYADNRPLADIAHDVLERRLHYRPT